MPLTDLIERDTLDFSYGSLYLYVFSTFLSILYKRASKRNVRAYVYKNCANGREIITLNAKKRISKCRIEQCNLVCLRFGSLRNLPYLQVHKGNLAVLKDNQRDIKVEQTNRQPKSLVITTPKGFSKTPPPPPPHSHANENDSNVENDTEKIEDSKKPETEDDKIKLQNGGQAVPPKPLPRASRTNSISEDEPKPVARPRTSPNPGSVVTSVNPNAIGGYKVVISLERNMLLLC